MPKGEGERDFKHVISICAGFSIDQLAYNIKGIMEGWLYRRRGGGGPLHNMPCDV